MQICRCDARGGDAISLAAQKRCAGADAGIAWGRTGVSRRKLFGMAIATMMNRPQRTISVLPTRAVAAKRLR